MKKNQFQLLNFVILESGLYFYNLLINLIELKEGAVKKYILHIESFSIVLEKILEEYSSVIIGSQDVFTDHLKP